MSFCIKCTSVLRYVEKILTYRTDTQAEVELVQKLARENGAFDAVICSHWAQGGLGAKALAEAVDKATQQPSNFQFLYDVKVWNINVIEKSL